MDDEQFLSEGGRPGVRVERRYAHPIATVWRAVTTPDQLAAWFPTSVQLDLRVGGALRFGDPTGGPAAATTTGTVQALEPPHLLAFTWGGDTLRFELAPTEGGTVFVLTHLFDDRAGAASFATGWEQCLGGLRHVLAGEPVPPPGRGIDRHEELVEAFGLDRPEVHDDGPRWAVRFERQLTCSAEVAWDLWFGVDRDTGEQRRAPAVGATLTPAQAPDMVVGTMTEVDRPRVLAFSVAPTGGPGEHVRVELAPGTGHGARLVLTVTGTDPDDRGKAVAQWGFAVAHLAHLAHEAARHAASPSTRPA